MVRNFTRKEISSIIVKRKTTTTKIKLLKKTLNTSCVVHIHIQWTIEFIFYVYDAT